eukprot:gene6741-3411_t
MFDNGRGSGAGLPGRGGRTTSPSKRATLKYKKYDGEVDPTEGTKKLPSQLLNELTQPPSHVDGWRPKPKIIELLNMADFTHQLQCIVPVDEPIFQPFPPEVIYSNYEPFRAYEAKLFFRNNDMVRTASYVGSREARRPMWGRGRHGVLCGVEGGTASYVGSREARRPMWGPGRHGVLCGVKGGTASYVGSREARRPMWGQGRHGVLCGVKGGTASYVGSREARRPMWGQGRHGVLCGAKGSTASYVGSREARRPMWGQGRHGVLCGVKGGTASFVGSREASRIKIVQPDTPYFSIKRVAAPGKELSDKVASGMEVTYSITFQPDSKGDFTCNLIVCTEREKFLVPVYAIGAAAALDLPDVVSFGPAACKLEANQTIFVRNVGSSASAFTLRAQDPFRVAPSQGFLNAGETLQIQLGFNPLEARDYEGELELRYANGRCVYLRLCGTGCELDVGLSSPSVSLLPTYVTKQSQRTFKVVNNSDVAITFSTRMFSNTEDEMMASTQKLDALAGSMNDTGREEGAGRAANGGPGEESDDEETILNSSNMLLTRRLKAMQRDVMLDHQLFGDKNFSVHPAEGTVWPRSEMELVVQFNPDHAREYTVHAFMDVQGRQDRLPLQINAKGLGPSAVFSYDVLDMGDAFANTLHQYEVELQNRGKIDVEYRLIPSSTPMGTRFSFEPSSGHMSGGEIQSIRIHLLSDLLGDFDETFLWTIKGAAHPLQLQFKGRVVGPSFEVDADQLDFGLVSYGFRYTKELTINNLSEIPMSFLWRVPEDVANPKEFQIIPQKGSIIPHGKQKITVEFVSETVQKYTSNLVLDIPKVADNQLTIPIKAECVVPRLMLESGTLTFGDCFLRFPYKKIMRLANDSKLPGKFEILPQDVSSTGIATFTAEPSSGGIPAKGEQEIEVTLTALTLGRLQIPVRMRAIGSKAAPLEFLLEARCLGPDLLFGTAASLVNENPTRLKESNINFGKVLVLAEHVANLHLYNPTPIPAQFKLFIEGIDSVFVVQPREAELQPNESLEVTVRVCLDEVQTFKDVLHVLIQEGADISVPLEASGTGNIFLSEELTSDLFDFSHQFKGRPFQKEVTIYNMGRKSAALTWENDRLAEVKRVHGKAARASGKKFDISMVPIKDQPVFSISPEKATLEPKEGAVFTIQGMAHASGEIIEHVTCMALVGANAKNPRKAYDLNIRAEVATPLLDFSERTLSFHHAYKKGDTIVTLHKSLTLRNISKLPLTFMLKPGGGPFVVDRPQVTLAVDEATTVNVSCDPVSKGDSVSALIKQKLKVEYTDNPQKDAVDLIAKIDFPNLKFESQSIEFGSCLADTTHRKAIRVTNCSDVEAKALPKPTAVQLFDILPITGALAPGQSELITYSFFAYPGTKASALSLCSVEGGPTYKVSMTGESNNIKYSVEPQFIDMGPVLYDKTVEKEIVIANNGKVPFDYRINCSNLQRSSVVTPVPASGVVGPGQKEVVKLKICAGIPDRLMETVLVELAHFDPVPIQIVMEGVYPAVSLALPRIKDQLFLKAYEEAVLAAQDLSQALFTTQSLTSFKAADTGRKLNTAQSNISAKSVAKSISKSTATLGEPTMVNQLSSEKKLDLEADRLRLISILVGGGMSVTSGVGSSRAAATPNPSDLDGTAKGLTSPGGTAKKAAKPKAAPPATGPTELIAANYLVDFGYVVKGTTKLWGFKVDPDAVAKLPGAPENGHVDISFTLQANRAQVQLGPMELILPLYVKNSPPVLITLRANVQVPDLKLSRDVLDFDSVQTGQCKVITVELHNYKQVPCEWQVKRPVENTKAKDWSYFRCEPSEGVLEPDQRLGIKVIFTPVMNRDAPYSQVLPIKIGLNPRSREMTGKGKGATPKISFTPSFVDCGPILPKFEGQTPNEARFQMVNPCNYPVEVFSLDFDTRFLEEDETLRTIHETHYDANGVMYKVPLAPGEGLWGELVDEVTQRKQMEKAAKDAAEAAAAAAVAAAEAAALAVENGEAPPTDAVLPADASLVAEAEGDVGDLDAPEEAPAVQAKKTVVVLYGNLDYCDVGAQADLVSKRYDVPATLFDDLLFEAADLEPPPQTEEEKLAQEAAEADAAATASAEAAAASTKPPAKGVKPVVSSSTAPPSDHQPLPPVDPSKPYYDRTISDLLYDKVFIDPDLESEPGFVAPHEKLDPVELESLLLRGLRQALLAESGGQALGVPSRFAQGLVLNGLASKYVDPPTAARLLMEALGMTPVLPEPEPEAAVEAAKAVKGKPPPVKGAPSFKGAPEPPPLDTPEAWAGPFNVYFIQLAPGREHVLEREAARHKKEAEEQQAIGEISNPSILADAGAAVDVAPPPEAEKPRPGSKQIAKALSKSSKPGTPAKGSITDLPPPPEETLSPEEIAAKAAAVVAERAEAARKVAEEMLNAEVDSSLEAILSTLRPLEALLGKQDYPAGNRAVLRMPDISGDVEQVNRSVLGLKFTLGVVSTELPGAEQDSGAVPEPYLMQIVRRPTRPRPDRPQAPSAPTLDPNFREVTRWVVPPNSTVDCVVHFQSEDIGKFTDTLGFEVVGGEKNSTIIVTGTCAFPQISSDFRNVFVNKVKARPSTPSIARQYIVHDKVFDFGPLLINKDSTGYREGAHPENTTRLRITNNGLFDNTVEFTLKRKAVENIEPGSQGVTPSKASKKPDAKGAKGGKGVAPGGTGLDDVFVLDPPTVDIKIDETIDLTVYAFPTDEGRYDDVIVCKIKDNPTPVEFPISVTGGKPLGKKGAVPDGPVNKLLSEGIVFGRLLWRLAGMDKVPSEFTITPDRGEIPARSNAKVAVQFNAVDKKLFDFKLDLEILDQQELQGVATSIPIAIKGEVRVIDSSMRQLSIKNTGKYQIQFNFAFKPASECKNIFSIVPETGLIDPGKETPIQFHLNKDRQMRGEVTLVSNTDISLSIVEPATNAKEQGPLPIPVTLRAVFSKYSVTPQRGMNFGPITYQAASKPKTLANLASGVIAPADAIARGKTPPVKGKATGKGAVGAALTIGQFTVTPSEGQIQPGARLEVSVVFNAEGDTVYSEKLGISRDYGDHPDGIPYEIVGESCIPGIDTTRMESIFEEHTIQSTLDPFNPINNEYGLRERVFNFGAIIADLNARKPSTAPMSGKPGSAAGGKKAAILDQHLTSGVRANLKFSNPIKVPCIVKFTITPKGQFPAGLPFPIEVIPSQLVIPPHEFRYAAIQFVPNAIQSYSATFEASVEGGSDPKTKGMTCEVRGEGTLPSISIQEPAQFDPSGRPLLSFGRLLLGRPTTLKLNLRNNGILPASARLDMEPHPNFTLLEGTQTFSVESKKGGYKEDVTFDGLPDGSLEQLKIPDGPLSVPRVQTFAIMNHSATKTMRFKWPPAAHPTLSFSPAIGHLLPGCTKDITLTFLTESPVQLSPQEVKMSITQINPKEPEPAVTEVPGTTKDIPLKIFATADNAKYECDVSPVMFRPTMMFQTRSFSFSLKNTCTSRLDYRFIVYFADGETIDTSGLLLKCEIPHLDASMAPLERQLGGKVLRPWCHFELPESDYINAGRRNPEMAGPSGTAGESLDPATKVLEFDSLGIKVRNTKRFFVLNPTSVSYEFFWEPMSSGEESKPSPFACARRKGVITAGRQVEMVFEYTPYEDEVAEAFWRFCIPEQNIEVPFLMVGLVTEPRVFFDRPSINFGQTLIGGARGKAIVKLVNSEHLPFQFVLDKNTYDATDALVRSTGRPPEIQFEPSSGTVPPNGSLQLLATFSPQQERSLNYNVVCTIKKKNTSLKLNVKGDGCAIRETLSIESMDSNAVVLAPKGATNSVDFGQVIVNERAVKAVVMINSGTLSYDFQWKMGTNPRVSMVPEKGTVLRGERMVCELSYLPHAPDKLNNYPISCQVINGNKYNLSLNAVGHRPRLDLSFSTADFGATVVYQPGMTPATKHLRLTNNDTQSIAIDPQWTNTEHWQVDLSACVLQPAEVKDVEIVFCPSAVTPYTSNLPLEINGLYTINVCMTGEGSAMRLELVKPEQRKLAFGSVTRGGATRVVTVVNNGRTVVTFDPQPSMAALERRSIGLIPNRPVTLKPRDTADLTFNYRPGSRMRAFAEDFVLDVGGVNVTLLQMTGACLGTELSLASDSLPFGPVVLGSRSVKRLALENTGDVGTKFVWNTAAMGPNFSVFPAEGFLAPRQDVKLDVAFHPTSVNQDIRVEKDIHLINIHLIVIDRINIQLVYIHLLYIPPINIHLDYIPPINIHLLYIPPIYISPIDLQVRLTVEGGEDQFLTLTGACSDLQPESEAVNFACSVRASCTQSVTLTNPSSSKWNLRPVIQNDFFSGPEFVDVLPNGKAQYTITFKPLSMSTAEQPHEGSVFFPIPDGTGLLYNVERNIIAKQTHVEVLKVSNWLHKPQRFKIIIDRKQADISTELNGPEYVDVPPLSTKDFKLTVFSYTASTTLATVTFKNENSGEFTFYDLKFLASAPPDRGNLILESPVRTLTTSKVTIKNPLSTDVVMKASCPNKSVIIAPNVTLKAKSLTSVEVSYRPLLVTESEAPLVLESPELGEFKWQCKLIGLATNPERSMTFNVPLGGSEAQTFRFTHWTEDKPEYKCTFKNPNSPFKALSAPLVASSSGAFSPTTGVELTLEVVFEPSAVGENLRDTLVVSSDTGGEYLCPLVGRCIPPKPQGPIECGKGSGQVPFTNVFTSEAEFLFSVDNPAFTVKPSEKIGSKKQTNISVSFKPLDPSKPRSGKLTVTCPSQASVAWVYYLQASEEAGRGK